MLIITPPCPGSAEDKFHIESHRCAPIKQTEGEDDRGNKVSPLQGLLCLSSHEHMDLLEPSFRSGRRRGGGSSNGQSLYSLTSEKQSLSRH